MYLIIWIFRLKIIQATKLTLQNATIFNSAVHETCDQVDQCIKNTYQLMAKFEELSTCAQQLPALAQNMLAFLFFLFLGIFKINLLIF